jgi:mandelate racemase
MKARALRVRAIDLPMARPTHTAAGAITSTPLALIELDTDAGVTGTTYVFCYSPPGLAAVVAALDQIDIAGAPLDGLWDALRRRFRLLGTQGVIGLAINGIDMAAWDARARAERRPLAALIGGRAGGRVTAYGSLKSASPGDLADEVRERAPQGFTRFKLKIGGGTLDDDLAAIAAVREASGGARLMVDYNQSLSREEALTRLQRLDREELEWIEEPLPAEDVDGYARLCAAIETPIQAGESWWSPEEAERHLAVGACDLAMPDVARVGGVTGWLRAAAAAHDAGVKVSTHNYPEVGLHLLASVPNAHLLEHLDKTSPLVRPLSITGGELTVPDEPGSSVAFSA